MILESHQSDLKTNQDEPLSNQLRKANDVIRGKGIQDGVEDLEGKLVSIIVFGFEGQLVLWLGLRLGATHSHVNQGKSAPSTLLRLRTALIAVFFVCLFGVSFCFPGFGTISTCTQGPLPTLCLVVTQLFSAP